MADIIRTDLNVIMELTDILNYTIKNHPRLAAGVTDNQKCLIFDLSNAIEKYRNQQKQESVV